MTGSSAMDEDRRTAIRARVAKTAEVGAAAEVGRQVIAAWRTNNRSTTYLIEHYPVDIWSAKVPAVSRLTPGMIAAHIHNARCRWAKALGASHGVAVPALVDPGRARPRDLLRALSRSSDGIIRLIRLGVARGGRVPPATWQNFPTDLCHFLGYFVAHEAHHRGQLCLVARQLGRRLPKEVAGGVWQWTRFSHECDGRRRPDADRGLSPTSVNRSGRSKDTR